MGYLLTNVPKLNYVMNICNAVWKMAGLASTREKRNNAGAKMHSLLEAEEEDDFYKTTYGGFNEVTAQFSSLLFLVIVKYVDRQCFP